MSGAGPEQAGADFADKSGSPVSITVLIPAYKGEKFLRRALDSALDQSFAPAEILVVDDGSPDECARIAEGYGQPVKVIRQANMGMAGARNRGIREASSSWIAFLDQDDISLRDRLKKTAEAIADNPRAKWIYSDFESFDERAGDPARALRQRIETPDPAGLDSILRWRCQILPSCSAVARDALLEVGGFDASPRMKGVDDWDLALRFCRRFSGDAFVRIREPLMLYSCNGCNFGRRPWDIFSARLAVLDRQLEGTSGVERTALRRKLMAHLYYETAILVRELNQGRHLRLMMKSLAAWPFANEILPWRRYKVLAHMLLRPGWLPPTGPPET